MKRKAKVWVIELKAYGRDWVPSSDYDTHFVTKKEALDLLKTLGEKKELYRTVRYQRSRGGK